MAERRKYSRAGNFSRGSIRPGHRGFQADPGADFHREKFVNSFVRAGDLQVEKAETIRRWPG